jgi:putative ABC transport system ATP-binding protein
MTILPSVSDLPRTGIAAARAVHVTKTYGTGAAEVRALDDITVDILRGQFTAVMGPSGSGKSTLTHCVAGLDSPSSGQVFVADVDLGTLSDRQLTLLRRERIGFVFQSYNLLPTLTAAENIALPRGLAGAAPDSDWLDLVVRTVGLTDRLTHRPAELSGGQQQRVAVARALAGQPELVFADEPTGNLDSRAGADILGFLRRAVDDLGQTIVVVTHDPVAASYADSVLFLSDGRISGQLDAPTPDRILDRLRALGG